MHSHDNDFSFVSSIFCISSWKCIFEEKSPLENREKTDDKFWE